MVNLGRLGSALMLKFQENIECLLRFKIAWNKRAFSDRRMH